MTITWYDRQKLTITADKGKLVVSILLASTQGFGPMLIFQLTLHNTNGHYVRKT